MESQKISDNFSDLNGNVKEYVHLRFNLMKLIITEKLASVGTYFIITVVFFILFLFVLMFLSLAFILWFREYAGPSWVGALIVAGVYMVIGFIVYLLRNKLFINPLVAQLSKIILEDDDKD
ncbi:MAG: phage holin family protein [Bacteroidetes bacterium]|nr:phage holin family protein [Bacteroidota bacterium]